MAYDRANLYKDAYVRNKITLEKSGMTVNDPDQPNTIRMAKSVIRSEVYATPGQSSFTFPILPNDPSPNAPTGTQTPTPTEVRLKQQDVFFACELGFFVYVQNIGTVSTAWRYVDSTFPDPNLGGSAWGSGFNLVTGLGLWTTAQLQVLVNNVTVTPLYPIKRHCKVPRIQNLYLSKYPPADASGGGTATGTETTFNPIRYADDGYNAIWPNWVLNGGNNNQYTLTFPAPISNFGVGGIGNAANFWFVLEWHGFLAQNASSIMSMNKK